MPQLNMQIDEVFSANIERFMARRGIRTRSEAIREALRIALRVTGAERDFGAWLGALSDLPERAERLFASDDELWR